MKYTLILTFCIIALALPVSAQPRPDRNPAPRTSIPRQSRAPNFEYLSPEMQAKVAVRNEDKAEFAGILKSSKGGTLAKIWNNPCKFEKVVNVQDVDCFQERNVNLASNFAFSRDFTYFGSIDLIKGEFETGSYGLIYAAMIDLGEVDFNLINKNSKAFEALGSFPLNVDLEMKKVSPTLNVSEYEGFTIKQKFPARLNHTYLLRSAMFGTKHIFTQHDTIKIPQMQESFFAFRVLKINDDVYTFIWKRIDTREKLLK